MVGSENGQGNSCVARRFGYPIPNMARIAICGAIIVVILLVLAAQRYIANKRLANNRPNKDEQ
jgi:hypothetical protein